MKSNPEPAANIGAICSDHGKARIAAWQSKNKNLVIGRGDYCKIAFHDKGNGTTEWMWVLVNTVPKTPAGLYKGRLDNDPAYDVGFKCGDTVEFKRTEVADRLAGG